MDDPLLARLQSERLARLMRSVAVRLFGCRTEFICGAVEVGPSERGLQTCLQKSHLGKSVCMRLRRTMEGLKDE